jgi:hypothetical protein
VERETSWARLFSRHAWVRLSSAHAIADAVGSERAVSRKIAEAPLFFGLFTTQLLVGAAAALIPGNLVHLVVQTHVLNGIISPGALDLRPGPSQPKESLGQRSTAGASTLSRPPHSFCHIGAASFTHVALVRPWSFYQRQARRQCTAAIVAINARQADCVSLLSPSAVY